MATVRQLTRLFNALAERDLMAADAIAAEVADDEERRGHRDAAQQLRGALRPNSRRSEFDGYAPSSAQDSAAITTALTPLTTTVALSDVEMPTRPRQTLHQIVREWQLREELSRNNVPRRTKILLHGPPGCGKSLTARAIGHELGLPVFVVRYDAVVGAFLGQTSLRIRLLFQFLESRPCIVLFDEIDAVGKRRGNPLDVGELDRIAITLLQELEHSRPSGLLIATSNVARHLDDALWRRFDLVLPFAKPTSASIRSFVEKRMAQEKLRPTNNFKRHIEQCHNYAEAVRIIENEKRRLILEGVGKS